MSVGPFLGHRFGDADGEEVGADGRADFIELAYLEPIELYAINTATDSSCNAETHFQTLADRFCEHSRQHTCLKDDRDVSKARLFV